MALVLLIVPLMAVLSLGGWHVVSADLYETIGTLICGLAREKIAKKLWIVERRRIREYQPDENH